MNRIEINVQTGEQTMITLTPEEEVAAAAGAVVDQAQYAAGAAGRSQDAAITADATLAQLKVMSATEFDTWWTANVTTAAQAIAVLKRLARVVLRGLR